MHVRSLLVSHTLQSRSPVAFITNSMLITLLTQALSQSDASAAA